MLKAGRAYHAAKAKRNSWPRVCTHTACCIVTVSWQPASMIFERQHHCHCSRHPCGQLVCQCRIGPWCLMQQGSRAAIYLK
jgi:hypothetical protein